MFHQYVFCYISAASSQLVKVLVSPEQYMRDMVTGGYQVVRISSIYCYYCNKSDFSTLKTII